MTPEIILHIGVHKTGSTHIQVALTRNSDWLIRQGIYYKPSDGVAHHSLIQSFADTKSDDLESAKIKISNMIKDAGSKDCKKIIISSEVMSESHINIEKLHKFISEIGSVSVYSYIRNPVDQLISAYNQIVRDNVHRRTFGFTLKNKGYDPSYKSMLFPWIDTGAQLKILPYDKNQWILNDIVSDFLFSIGASKYDQYSKENIVKTSNGSLPYPLL
ncbi:MAG: hypothetical protein H6890_07965, partial [Brucellaceae bacterium]|nr:hypothetical protein [Brucellaceae bacterium]